MVILNPLICKYQKASIDNKYLETDSAELISRTLFQNYDISGFGYDQLAFAISQILEYHVNEQWDLFTQFRKERNSLIDRR